MTSELPGRDVTSFRETCDAYTKMLQESTTHRIETYVDGGKTKLRSVPIGWEFFSMYKGEKIAQEVDFFVGEFLRNNATVSQKSEETAKAYSRLKNAYMNYIEREFSRDQARVGGVEALWKSVRPKQQVEHAMMMRAVKEDTTDPFADCTIICKGKVKISVGSEYLIQCEYFEGLFKDKDLKRKEISLVEYSPKIVNLAIAWMKYNEIPPCTLEELTELRKLSAYLACEGLTCAVNSIITGVPLNPVEQGKRREQLRNSVAIDPRSTDCVIKYRRDESEGKEKLRFPECHSLVLKRCDRIAPHIKGYTKKTEKEGKEKSELESERTSPPPNKELNLEEFSKGTISLFLDWLYTDSLLTPCTPQQLVQLLALAETVGCKSLIEYCKTQLTRTFYKDPTELNQLILDPHTPPLIMEFLVEQFASPNIPKAELYKPYFPELQKKFSEKSDPASVTALATLFLKCGDPIPEDVLKQLTLSAEREAYAPAQFVVGCLYKKGLSGFTEDSEIAERFFELAANQGYAPAEYLYAEILNIRSTVWEEKEKYAKLSKMFSESAAKQGYPPAQYNRLRFSNPEKLKNLAEEEYLPALEYISIYEIPQDINLLLKFANQGNFHHKIDAFRWYHQLKDPKLKEEARNNLITLFFPLMDPFIEKDTFKFKKIGEEMLKFYQDSEHIQERLDFGDFWNV